MTYVDGYLVPVRPGMRAAYLELSSRMAPVLKEYGALRVVECWQDTASGDAAGFHAEGARDALEEAGGPARAFPTAAGAEDGEVVVFSWTEWPDKATRDAGLVGFAADPRVQPRDSDVVVFEGRRLIAGGFEVVVDV